MPVENNNPLDPRYYHNRQFSRRMILWLCLAAVLLVFVTSLITCAILDAEGSRPFVRPYDRRR